MSKLHGRPVIGHRLLIKALNDSFHDGLLGLSECYSSSSELDYINLVGVSDFQGYEQRSCGWPPSKTKSRRKWLLSKKTRKLSSLTSSHRQSQHEKKSGFGKHQGSFNSLCPLGNFSRINEALNSSIRPPPRLTTTGNI